MKILWRIWGKALGEKAGKTDTESDMIAIVGTLFIISTILCEWFIIVNILHHW